MRLPGWDENPRAARLLVLPCGPKFRMENPHDEIDPSACQRGCRSRRYSGAYPSSNPRAQVAKTGRNEPCPCGSGRKYKLCCGALVMVTTPSAPPRACGPCTACCEGWAEGEIQGHRMSPGQPCHFLRPAPRDASQASPCSIYDERPQSPCRRFVCGWLAPGSPFPDSFRPDRAGFILVPLRWRQRPAWVLLPAGRDPDDDAISWMQARARATGEPFFYERQGERIGYGPPEFQQEMHLRLQRGERLW